MKYMLINFVPETAPHFYKTNIMKIGCMRRKKYFQLLNVTRTNNLDYILIVL